MKYTQKGKMKAAILFLLPKANEMQTLIQQHLQ